MIFYYLAYSYFYLSRRGLQYENLLIPNKIKYKNNVKIKRSVVSFTSKLIKYTFGPLTNDTNTIIRLL